jgi:predicted transcriptional regulator YdeE
MEIKKVYKESIPHVKLIGRRLTNNDRDETGTFARHWQQSFREGWFDILKACKGLSGVSDDYLGAMRMTGESGDGFEYWIGMFRAPDAEVPVGFESVEIPAGEVGVCWLYGSDKTGELYSMEASDLSMAALKEQGWDYAETGWFFERYNCPRFTAPDEKGNVILDICAYLI